ncbi:MAG: EamA family transporter [Planctomycetota bacterium]|jgi:transporter family protein
MVKGKASVVVPLTALYPVVTLVLVFVFLREPLTAKQGVGIALALAAMVLFSL